MSRRSIQILGTTALLLAVPASTAVADAPAALSLESHPLAGRVFALDDRVEIGPRALIERAILSRFVLLGETHDNPRHHELQARVLEAVAAAGRRPLVAWEMIDQSRADALADCLAHCEDWLHELPQRIGWDESGWPAWQMYEPIAAVAAQYGLTLAAANLSPAEAQLLAGPPSPDSRQLAATLGIEATLSAAARAALAATIEDSHCGLPIPPPRLEAMVGVQRARDRRMREVLVERAGSDGSVLIAGSGHTRLDWGVGRDLSREFGSGSVLSVAFIEVHRDCRTVTDCVHDRAERRAPWHVVWFTARAERDDPCERLRGSGRFPQAAPSPPEQADESSPGSLESVPQRDDRGVLGRSNDAMDEMGPVPFNE